MDPRLVAAMAMYRQRTGLGSSSPAASLPAGVGGGPRLSAFTPRRPSGGSMPQWMVEASQRAGGQSQDRVTGADHLKTINLAANSPAWMREAALKIAHEGQGRHPHGMFGRILDNPVTRTLLKPLEVIDSGRRAVQSGIREGVDFFDTNPDSSATFGDWWKQTKDPSTNLNKLFPGTIWKNPIIGFAGDVATDPLTYVTLGAGRFAGAGGRLAAAEAAHAAEASIGREAAETLAAKAARLGVSSLSAEERAAIGLDRAGLRFMGARLPATEGVAKVLGEGGARLRNAVQDTGLYQKLREGTMLADTAPSRMALLRGTSENVSKDLGLIAADAAKKGGSGRFRAELLHEARNTLGNKEGLSHDLHEVIEGVRPPASVEEAGAANRISSLLQSGFEKANEAGANIPYRENYFPHVLSDEAKDAFKKAPELKGYFVDSPTARSGVTLARELNPGDEFLGVPLETASVSEINQIVRDKIPSFTGDLFETNPLKAVGKWVGSAGDAVGQARMGAELANRGLAKGIEPIPAIAQGGSEEAQRIIKELEPIVAARRAPLSREPGQAVNQLGDDAVQTARRIDTAKVPEETVFANAKELGPDAFVDNIEEGWSRLGNSGYQIPPEIRDAMTRIEALRQPGNFDGLLGLAQRYTQFFKTYATMSPGFHVRNALSATFNNFVAGVSPVAQAKAITALSKFFDNPTLWEHTATDLEKAAMDAVYQSGGNMFDDALHGVGELGGRKVGVTNNPLTRMSKRAGERVEGTVRYGMALDTLEKGGSVAEAAQRISRFHFNYGDFGKYDQMAKTVIPFWMFTSRNLPLQMTEMWLNPRMYQLYGNAVRNIQKDDSGNVVPGYFNDIGAFPIGGKTYLAPDLPFTRLSDQSQLLTDPIRFGSQMSPVFRLPIELAAGKKLYSGQAIDDQTLHPLAGWKQAEIPLLALMGQLKRTDSGGFAASDRGDYILSSLLPSESQASRLLPTDAGRQQRQLSSILSYFGVPVRQLTETDQKSEEKRRRALILAMQDRGDRWDRTDPSKRVSR